MSLKRDSNVAERFNLADHDLGGRDDRFAGLYKTPEEDVHLSQVTCGEPHHDRSSKCVETPIRAEGAMDVGSGRQAEAGATYSAYAIRALRKGQELAVVVPNLGNADCDRCVDAGTLRFEGVVLCHASMVP